MRRTLVLLPALLMAASCVSVLPTPEAPTALYRIGPVDPIEGISLASHVIITEPEAPAIVGSRAMSVQDEDGGFAVLRSAEWTDSATRLLQLGLLDALSGAEGQGLAISGDMAARADYELRWRIADYAIRGETAHCDLSLTLLEARSRRPVAQTSISTSESVGSRRPTDQAEALQRVGRQSLTQAAEFIRDEVERAEASD